MDKVSFLHDFMESVWNQKRIEEVPNFVHPSYTIHLDTADPWEGETLSHEEFVVRLNHSFGSFPDMHFEITSSIPEAKHVAITWILTGTHLGNIGPLPPTNNAIRTNGMTIYHFTDNLLSGHTQVFDRLTIAKQLGLMH